MHRDILAENELTLDFSLVIDVIVMSLNLLDTVIKEKPEKGKLIRMSEWWTELYIIAHIIEEESSNVFCSLNWC